MKKESIRTRKAFFTGFVMTLILCSFVLFASLAIWNTARDMFGSDVPLVEAEADRSSSPEISVRIIDTEYEIELTGLNEAARLAQRYYPLIPRGLRGAGYLAEGLRQGMDALQRAQERTELGGKIFCRK